MTSITGKQRGRGQREERREGAREAGKGFDSLSDVNTTTHDPGGASGRQIQDTPVSTIAHLITARTAGECFVSLPHTQTLFTTDYSLLSMTAK